MECGAPLAGAEKGSIILCAYTIGWVNLYQKFEIENYTVCGKLVLAKKIERHFIKFFLATTGLRMCMDL